MSSIKKWTLFGLSMALFALWGAEATAYQRYNDGCHNCHGSFTDDISPKGSVFPSDDKHYMHRNRKEMDTECTLCHTNGDNKNPFIGSSDGTSDNIGYGCCGCHGRLEDAGHDVTVSPGLGAGLRQHHTNAGVDMCKNCHVDSSPANYTPVGEEVVPPYYATPDVDSAVVDPLNLSGLVQTDENWTIGDFEGLDNDGDGVYDAADAPNDPPTADAAGPYTVDDGQSVAFDGTGSSDPDGTIASYDWDFGDGNSGTGASPNHTYAAAGTYTATLTVTDNGGATATAAASVTINPIAGSPVPDAGGPYSANAGDVVTFDGSASTDDGTIVSYAWDFGDGNTGAGVGPTHTYASGGLFTVTLIVTDDSGLATKGAGLANINAPPVANPGGPYACAVDQAATFVGSGSTDDGTIVAYDWDFGDTGTGTGASPTHTYLAEGVYIVSLTVTDDLGVTHTAATTATVALAQDMFTPVNQFLGMDDTIKSPTSAAECRGCHDPGINDTHHLLYGSAAADPSVAPWPDPSGMYTCMSCHGSTFVAETNCLVCHVDAQAAHHDSPDAAAGACNACHGYVVAWGSVLPPSYNPSLVTPSRTGEHGEPGGLDDGDAEPSFVFDNGESDGDPIVYRGVRNFGPGGCDYCHNALVDIPAVYDGGVVVTPATLVDDINTNHDTHHHAGTSLIKDIPAAAACSACHTAYDGTFAGSDGDQIRVCEKCHSRQMLHNTQVDSNGDESTEPGTELAGYGHVGRDAGPGDSDCWGCHGFAFGGASAPDTSALVGTIYGCDPSALVAGTATQVLVIGTVFTNTAAGVDYSSNVVLTAADGSSVTLAPDSIDGETILVTIPAGTAAGNYTLKAVKTNAAGEPVPSNSVGIVIAPGVTITEVTYEGDMVTIDGAGFAGYAEGSPTSVTGTITGGKGKKTTPITVTGTIVEWTDTEIKVTFDSVPSDVTVVSVFGSATADVASNGGGKPNKGNK